MFQVSVFLLVGVVLAGAGLGFWLVRKFFIAEDGSVDVGIAQFVKWAIRMIAVTFIFQVLLRNFSNWLTNFVCFFLLSTFIFIALLSRYFKINCYFSKWLISCACGFCFLHSYANLCKVPAGLLSLLEKNKLRVSEKRLQIKSGCLHMYN